MTTFQIDNDPTTYTIDEMLEANEGDEAVAEALPTLAVGETATFGGGGAAETRVTRVS
jgi:hypothetical protein